MGSNFPSYIVLHVAANDADNDVVPKEKRIPNEAGHEMELCEAMLYCYNRKNVFQAK